MEEIHNHAARLDLAAGLRSAQAHAALASPAPVYAPRPAPSAAASLLLAAPVSAPSARNASAFTGPAVPDPDLEDTNLVPCWSSCSPPATLVAENSNLVMRREVEERREEVEDTAW